MMSYKDKIITFPLFNTCYPQNLVRNLARFSKVTWKKRQHRPAFSGTD